MNSADSTPNSETYSPQSTPRASHSKSIARSAGIVSLAVMGSRVLGLVREQVFAFYFGASFANDAFIVAFRIPNLLRDLFAEGALSSAFVTTFSQTLKQKGDREAWRLANLVNNAQIIVLSLIVLLGIIFAPQIVDWMMHPPELFGFTMQAARLRDPAKAELTTQLAVTMTRIMFPFLLMISLAAVAMGVLNTKDRFGVPASASTLFNVGSIFGGLGAAYLLAPGYITAVTSGLLHGHKPPLDVDGAARAIVGMAIGTLVGGMMQWLIQVPSLRAVGYRWQPILSFRDEGMRQVLRLMAPAIVGASAVQVNVVINTTLAAGLGEGAISWLGYAFRLILFPIGVFGVAISTATLPVASRAAVEDLNRFRHTIASSLRLTMLLNIPSTVGLMILSQPIIALIYQHGSFSAQDTRQAASALVWYALGLTAYSMIKILAPAFYALGDTRIPMMTSVLSIVTNYAVATLTINQFGHRALALSISAVAIVNCVLLMFFLRRRLGGIEGRGLLLSFGQVTLASLVMGAVCWFISAQAAQLLGTASLLARVLTVGVSVATGALVFVLAAKLLRVSELNQLIGVVERRLGRKRNNGSK
ncbi:MAG TPA: murein biosynthesis integral membrane protein MurJ [Blastocatellia bacterium]|nr:murein biosynthesis integral membrane protein MurJ [Blastocatellia bacterium]